MAKIRLKRVTIIEYEPDMTYYPDGSTIEDAAKIDADTDDRDALFTDCVSETVTWEIIE